MSVARIGERLSVDLVYHSNTTGAQRLSLAFAAFADLLGDPDRGWIKSLRYLLIHLIDPLIASESIYRYLRKFHSFADKRYVLLPMRYIVPAAFVLLSFEFMPHRRHLTVPARPR